MSWRSLLSRRYGERGLSGRIMAVVAVAAAGVAVLPAAATGSVRVQAVAGTISTIAGGVGGPGRATEVANFEWM